MNLEIYNLTTEDLCFLKNKYINQLDSISKQIKDLLEKEKEIFFTYNEICEKIFKKGKIE